MLELPCATAHLPLRKQAARLQTIRSIGLVKEGILYCSSIFGARNTPIRQLQPDLPAVGDLLLLSTDQSLLKGSPILIQWYPASADGEDGVMEIVNIDLLTTMLLEPQQPQITSASLTVGKRHLLYGRGVVDTLPELKKMKSVTSFHRDISLYYQRQRAVGRRTGVQTSPDAVTAGRIA